MSYLYEHQKDRKGTEYIEITGYEGGVRHLVIPEAIEELPVRSIGKSAFSGRNDLISVELPETIEILGRYAFYNCKNLRTMCLYDGVEDYYDGVIKQCQSLSEITLYQKRDSYSVMKELLADNDRRLTFMIEPIGLRLTFPAYVYDFVEDVEARVLHHKIEGSGYPYRECVTRKGVDLLAYDKLFDHVISDDYEAAIMVALNRLRYPVELEAAAKEQYEQYLEQNARIVLQKLIGHAADAAGWRSGASSAERRKEGQVADRAGRDDSPVAELRYLCDECLIPRAALEDGLYEAAEKKLSEITAILMEYQRLNFAGHQQQTKMTLDDW